MDEHAPPLQLVKRADLRLEGGKAVYTYKVEPLAPTDEGDFEYFAVVHIPSLDLIKSSATPLAVHLDRDATHVEIFLLERKGESVVELDYEIEFPDGEKRQGATDGGGYLLEEKKGK